jgi:hypothetical protein
MGLNPSQTSGKHAQQTHTFNLFTISRCPEQRVLATQGRGGTLYCSNTILSRK